MHQSLLNPVNGLCTGCGVCVSESKGTLRMDWNAHGFLTPHSVGGPIPTEVLRVCPFNPHPDHDVRDEDRLAEIFISDAKKFNPLVGKFNDTYIGYCEKYRKTSSSGGIATYVFYQLLKKRLVDHLFVVISDGSGYKYKIFSEPEDITRISKTRYYPVTMERLFEELENVEGRVAVSGVACFIKALRLKQYYSPDLRVKIPFLVGIICGGLKSKFFTDFLAQSAGILSDYQNQEYRIKDPDSTATDYSFGATTLTGNYHHIKMSKVGDMWGSGLFKSEACDYCNDVLTELADISIGDAWLPDYRNDGLGNSVIITRSLIAEQLIRDGIKSGELYLTHVAPNIIVDSQKASFAHRQKAAKFRNWVATFRGIPIPPTRVRLLTSISSPYVLVQILRLITRAKSLSYWHTQPKLASFNKRIAKYLMILNGIQKLYHLMRSR